MLLNWILLLCLLVVSALTISVPTVSLSPPSSSSSSSPSYNVLHDRNVFTCGFGDSLTFPANFLQPHHLHKYKHFHQFPFANASNADIVVVYGIMPHCVRACRDFKGLIIYLDNEAGRPVTRSHITNYTQHNLAHMIYLGVSTINLPPAVTKIPCIFGVQTLQCSSATVKKVFSRHLHIQYIQQKTHFLAYAATKCLPMRELVFDALVSLSIQHDLGTITAFGACHGSARNANYSHTHTHTAATHSITKQNRSVHHSSSSGSSSDSDASDTSRKHFRNNGVLFQPFKYVLAMENDDVDRYMTEKIFLAYQAGAIPLYWGASSIVHDMFHPDTFIYIDPLNLQAALTRILEIERDPALYRRILQTPVLLRGEETVKKYLAVGIPAISAADPRLYNASISNRIWAEIIRKMNPLRPTMSSSALALGDDDNATMLMSLLLQVEAMSPLMVLMHKFLVIVHSIYVYTYHNHISLAALVACSL